MRSSSSSSLCTATNTARGIVAKLVPKQQQQPQQPQQQHLRSLSSLSASSASLSSSSSSRRPLLLRQFHTLQQQQQPQWPSPSSSIPTASFPSSSSSRFMSSSTPPPPPPKEEEKEKEKEKVKENEEEESTTTAAEEAADAQQVQAQKKEEEETIQKLELQIKELKDSLLRSMADQENTRNIAQKDIESARNFAISSFAKSLLDVSDNLQRALDSVSMELVNEIQQKKKNTTTTTNGGGNNVTNGGTSNTTNNTEQTLVSLYEGIELTNNELMKAFSKNKLMKYCEVPGDIFNPEEHEALLQYPVDDDDSDDPNSPKPGTIGQVIKCGYKLNNRVLRSAQVGVAVSKKK